MTKTNRKPKKTKGLGAGIIAFGLVFAGFSAIFHPHSLGGYILAFVLSGLAGSIVKVMGEGLDLTPKPNVPESMKNMMGDTGNPDVDALLQQGREMILEIRTENDKIPEASLSAKLDELESQCGKIFQTIYEKPAKAAQIRKFMGYYLPTTLKMVKAYRVLGEQNMSGEDIIAARHRIDDALGVVLKACQKMLDNLYRNDVLDITTDIDVLEQMLKRDGLTESDLSLAAAQARQAAQIDRVVSAASAQTQTTTAQASASPIATAQQSPLSPGGQAMAQMPQKSE